MRGRRCEARSEAPAEREFPALLVCIAGCLGVPADPNIFWNFFFSRVSAKKNIGHFSPFRGVFVLLGGVFALLGGVFALLGCFFLFFARQREFVGGVNCLKAYHTKTGNSRSELRPARRAAALQIGWVKQGVSEVNSTRFCQIKKNGLVGPGSHSFHRINRVRAGFIFDVAHFPRFGRFGC